MKEYLKSISLFADLSDEDLNNLCSTSREVVLPAGEELFEEGTIGDCAYI